MEKLLDKLHAEGRLDKSGFVRLIRDNDAGLRRRAAEMASAATLSRFGDKVYIRGLIEFTNFCKNDCLYCGIRRGNRAASRYRLAPEEILACCREGYGLGFRTFVLQGGEDEHFADGVLVPIVAAMREEFPDCAITLSMGERSRDSYRRLLAAGANRYLLRHETATPEHYARLHPASLSLENRKRCLADLKDLGYQTGSGFMVGSPWQTPENLAEDMLFLRELDPEMVGIGPFLPHRDTPFADFPAGSVELTLFLLSLTRLMLPCALIPATTALGTAAGDGRERGILAGANVVMPNLSPSAVRSKYLLYDGKICTDAEAAEHVAELDRRMRAIGRRVTPERGDYSREDFPGDDPSKGRCEG